MYVAMRRGREVYGKKRLMGGVGSGFEYRSLLFAGIGTGCAPISRELNIGCGGNIDGICSRLRYTYIGKEYFVFFCAAFFLPRLAWLPHTVHLFLRWFGVHVLVCFLSRWCCFDFCCTRDRGAGQRPPAGQTQ